MLKFIFRKHFFQKLLSTLCKKAFALSFYSAFFIILSCSKNQKNTATDTTSPPDWYINSQKSNGLYLYGVGEGRSLSTAQKNALNDIASKLRVDISSTTTTNMRADNDSFSNSVRQNITSSVEQITFNNFEVSKTAVVGDTIYSEVKIDRQKMLDEKQTELEDIVAKIKNIKTNAALFTNILEKRLEYKKISLLLPKLKSNSYLLYALEGEIFDIKSHLQIARDFENEYSKFISQIVFKIESCPAKDALKNIITSQGLKVSDSTTNAANLVFVKCNVSLTNKEIYGRYYTKGQLTTSLEASGKELISKTVSFGANSSISFPEAAKNAYQNIADGNLLTDDDKQKDNLPTLDDNKAAEKVLGL